MKDEEKRIFIKIHNELINALSTVEDEMRAELCDLSDYEDSEINAIFTTALTLILASYLKRIERKKDDMEIIIKGINLFLENLLLDKELQNDR